MKIKVAWNINNQIIEIGYYDTDGNSNIDFYIGKNKPPKQHVCLKQGLKLLPLKSKQQNRDFDEMRKRAQKAGVLNSQNVICSEIWAVGLSEAGRFFNGGETSGASTQSLRFWSLKQAKWIKKNEAEKEYGVTFGERDTDKENTNNNEQSKVKGEAENFTGDVNEPPKQPHNRIVFGAPGTGKSHRLNLETQGKGNLCVERVTFHPDYSYAHFVGTYKPVMIETGDKYTNGESQKAIEYKFVPGPFLRTYANAKTNSGKNYVLIIEEINRANVAAVFGDVFQLLDRHDKDGENGEIKGESEYPVNASEDVKNWLTAKGIKEETLSLPKNMYIWATMNSADQGVYPMDTAFKRRWTFEYIGINDNEKKVKDWEIKFGDEPLCKWNDLRKAINEKLIESKRVNEDKCLGPRFVKQEECKDFDKFTSKVLMYLFEDVVKQKPSIIFKEDLTIFSKIRKEFEVKGLAVFNFAEDTIKKLKESVDTKNGNKAQKDTPQENAAVTTDGEDNN